MQISTESFFWRPVEGRKDWPGGLPREGFCHWGWTHQLVPIPTDKKYSPPHEVVHIQTMMYTYICTFRLVCLWAVLWQLNHGCPEYHVPGRWVRKPIVGCCDMWCRVSDGNYTVERIQTTHVCVVVLVRVSSIQCMNTSLWWQYSSVRTELCCGIRQRNTGYLCNMWVTCTFTSYVYI